MICVYDQVGEAIIWDDLRDLKNTWNILDILWLIPSLKLTGSPLKMDGWNTTFLLGCPIFRCKLAVSFREGISSTPPKTNMDTVPKMMGLGKGNGPFKNGNLEGNGQFDSSIFSPERIGLSRNGLQRIGVCHPFLGVPSVLRRSSGPVGLLHENVFGDMILLMEAIRLTTWDV